MLIAPSRGKSSDVQNSKRAAGRLSPSPSGLPASLEFGIGSRSLGTDADPVGQSAVQEVTRFQRLEAKSPKPRVWPGTTPIAARLSPKSFHGSHF